jgi:hypothetical protein
MAEKVSKNDEEVSKEQGGVNMATYVILSRVSPQALEDSKEFKQLAEKVSAKTTPPPSKFFSERLR